MGDQGVRVKHIITGSRQTRVKTKTTTVEQCFPVVLFIMLKKVVLTFESVDDILKYDHSSERY